MLDAVIIGDANETLLSLPDGHFDLLVCNDFLEHIVDPVGFLSKACTKLIPGGHFLCSLPNFRYLENLFGILVRKDFRYMDSGILDYSHLRFFTARSMKRLFREQGMEVEVFRGINTVIGVMGFFMKLWLWALNSSDMLHPQFVVLARRRDA